MTDLVSRRELILGVGSTALLGALGQRDALALDFSSTFGAVVGSLGVGLFPGAAAALRRVRDDPIDSEWRKSLRKLE